MTKISCPGCRSTINTELTDLDLWSSHGGMPINCDKCGMIYMIRVTTELAESGITFDPPSKTSFDIGDHVFIFNKEHKLHLRYGIIENKDHLSYRIKFDGNIMIWVPHEWVRLLPGIK